MDQSFGSVSVSDLDGHIAFTTRSTAGQTMDAVWLHGLGGASSALSRVVEHPALAASSALLVDLPGHGQSSRPAEWSYRIEAMADVVAQVIAALTSGPVAIVGHSMGGSVAIDLAYRYPNLVRALVVAEPNLDPGVGTISTHIAHQTEARFTSHGYRALVRAVRGDRDGSHAGSSWPETLAQASPVALHRAATSLLAEREPTFRAMFERLAQPRTFIAGEKTHPRENRLPPSVQVMTIPRAGHEMWVDNLEDFARAVAKGSAAG